MILNDPGNGTRTRTLMVLYDSFSKKRHALPQYSQQELNKVAAQLNRRPRKTLKFKTPKEAIENGVDKLNLQLRTSQSCLTKIRLH